MNRREFAGGLAPAILAAPLAAEAQQVGKVPRIAFLTTTPRRFWRRPQDRQSPRPHNPVVLPVPRRSGDRV